MSRPDTIIGSAPPLLVALETAARFGPTEMPVLIVGATGTGKELFARYLHDISRREGPLVDVDCGAIPDELFESVLFGHRRGAFTGAVEHAEGILSKADGGTLFLDELGSLPPKGQAKLLRVLETGEVHRVGGARPRRVDFRLVATVQSGIASMLEDGAFRLDLIQRVAGAVIQLPTLAERPEDVLPLARHFAASVGVRLTPGAELLLEQRCWPGNVRELRWAVLRAALFQREGEVTEPTMCEALQSGPSALLNGQNSSASESMRLRAACRAYHGDADQIAAAMRIGRSTLYRKLREFSLDLRTYRVQGVSTS